MSGPFRFGPESSPLGRLPRIQELKDGQEVVRGKFELQGE